MAMNSLDEEIEAAYRLEKSIWPILKGHRPEVQNVVIADMLATFLAGHAPPLREVVLEQTIELVKTLLPVNEAILFEGKGHPYTLERPMEKTFDEALMDLIDEYMIAAEQNDNGDVAEMREDIISALELRLMALKEESE
ncbi:hypothetical protein V3589_14860 [Sinorhizobium fredii]|uniref:hypothetical protein n=1 Tax=Rhizobium fredii TaxID=380 RepID=UPI0030A561EC